MSNCEQPALHDPALHDLDWIELQSTLHNYALMGDLDMVEFLLNGDNVNAQDNLYRHGASPLHEAAEGGHAEVVKLLVDHGANINAENNFGCRPLHRAAFEAHRDTVYLLLSNGADDSLTDHDGDTPLDIARMERRSDVVELLTNPFTAASRNLMHALHSLGTPDEEEAEDGEEEVSEVGAEDHRKKKHNKGNALSRVADNEDALWLCDVWLQRTDGD